MFKRVAKTRMSLKSRKIKKTPDDGFVVDVSSSQIAFPWNAEKYALSCIFPPWSSYVIMLVSSPFHDSHQTPSRFARISWFHPAPIFPERLHNGPFYSSNRRPRTPIARTSVSRDDERRSRGRSPKFFRVISPASMAGPLEFLCFRTKGLHARISIELQTNEDRNMSIFWL